MERVINEPVKPYFKVQKYYSDFHLEGRSKTKKTLIRIVLWPSIKSGVSKKQSGYSNHYAVMFSC